MLNKAVFFYLKASPLPPTPLASAGLLVAGLVLGNILIGLLACWLVGLCCLAFVLLVLSVGMFAGSLLCGC